MARKIWTGSINFGLVTIPVGLYSATEDHTISFHQYERGTTDRVRYRRVNERTGEEVGYNDVVKGREVDGTLITVEPSELEEIAPGRSRTIDITEFVSLDEIDPIYFQKTYWLAPNSKEHYRSYNLLRQAMENTNQVGIARFVLRGKEYLTSVRAEDSVLALDTMFFADEIRSPSEVVEEDADTTRSSEQELKMAATVIESMSGQWTPEEYEDTYTARVEQLIQDKSEGRAPAAESAPPQPTDVIDLTDVLRRSVQGGSREKSRQRRGGAADEIASLSKSDLDKRAKEFGIRGRSKMKRSDLESAVTEALEESTGGKRTRKAS